MIQPSAEIGRGENMFHSCHNPSVRAGATIILTSHYMDDVAALCPRIIVIDQGHLIHDGPLAELARRIRPEKRVVLRLGRDVDAADVADITALGGRVLSREGNCLTLSVAQGDLHAVVSTALAKLPVDDLNVEDPPLEEIMADLFAQNKGAAG